MNQVIEWTQQRSVDYDASASGQRQGLVMIVIRFPGSEIKVNQRFLRFCKFLKDIFDALRISSVFLEQTVKTVIEAVSNGGSRKS